MLSIAVAIAALALAVCLVDLILTVGVIRRLREHTNLIAELRPNLELMLSEGQVVAPFSATATTGELLSRETLSGETLVAAFAIGCAPCSEQLPVFVDYASEFPGGREQVIAVVFSGSDSDEEALEFRRKLEPVSRVVVERPGRQPGKVSTALAVEANPVFGIVDSSGVVLRSNLRLDERPAAALSV